MPRRAKELSAKAVAALSKDGMHAVGGADGLLLQIQGEGTRSWVLRVRIHGRRRCIGLGSYRDVTLAEARARARDMRSTVAAGGDPLADRRAARAEALAGSNVLTFDECARRHIAAKSAEWSNAKHRAQWTNTLETYASPVIGKMPVQEIAVADVLRVLQPIWTGKTETAKRVQLRIESVIDWAIAAELRTSDNPARWKGKLDKLLAKPTRVKKVKHHAALPVDDLPDFMVALRAREGLSPRALEFAILTAARSGEVRGATWDEIDLDGATWTIPSDRMKAGKDHRVPLSAPALQLLRALPRLAGTDLLFPGAKGQPLSDMALLSVMKRMKAPAVPHGFRSTFRDWASERTSYPHEVAEMALAHAIASKTEKAYRRGDLLAKRARMMEDWARFIDTPTGSGTVVQLHKEKVA